MKPNTPKQESKMDSFPVVRIEDVGDKVAAFYGDKGAIGDTWLEAINELGMKLRGIYILKRDWDAAVMIAFTHYRSAKAVREREGWVVPVTTVSDDAMQEQAAENIAKLTEMAKTQECITMTTTDGF